jgi:hypothetical protein
MQAWPFQKDCDAYYGNPRGKGGSYSPAWAAANLVHVPCPWPLFIEKKAVAFITIHRRCSESLTRVLTNIAHRCTPAEIKALKYDVFDGSFNYRPMRGSRALSMHSYGCAIDWDAEDNPFRSKKHTFKSDSPLVLAFKAEGWAWGGDWDAPDAMHVQAARVR